MSAKSLERPLPSLNADLRLASFLEGRARWHREQADNEFISAERRARSAALAVTFTQRAAHKRTLAAAKAKR